MRSYLKLSDPDLGGGSDNDRHPGQIEVLAWSQSFAQPAHGAEDRSDAVASSEPAEFVFHKYLDDASDGLLRHCWNGKPIGKAVLSCFRSDGEREEYLYHQVEMTGVTVAGVAVAGGTGDLPTETVTLKYDSVAYSFSSPDGTTRKVRNDLVSGTID